MANVNAGVSEKKLTLDETLEMIQRKAKEVDANTRSDDTKKLAIAVDLFASVLRAHERRLVMVETALADLVGRR